MKPSTFRFFGKKAPFEDPPDNSAIQQLRAQITSLTADLATQKTENATLKDKVTQTERERLDELERVKLEKVDLEKQIVTLTAEVAKLEPLQKRVTDVHTFVETNYNEGLEKITDEKEREKFKLLTFVEGDPVASLTKLNTTMAIIFGEGGLKVGDPTKPGAGPNKEEPKDKVFDPKNISWADALRPRADIVAEFNNAGRQPK